MSRGIGTYPLAILRRLCVWNRRVGVEGAFEPGDVPPDGPQLGAKVLKSHQSSRPITQPRDMTRASGSRSTKGPSRRVRRQARNDEPAFLSAVAEYVEKDLIQLLVHPRLEVDLDGRVHSTCASKPARFQQGIINPKKKDSSTHLVDEHRPPFGARVLEGALVVKRAKVLGEVGKVEVPAPRLESVRPDRVQLRLKVPVPERIGPGGRRLEEAPALLLLLLRFAAAFGLVVGFRRHPVAQHREDPLGAVLGEPPPHAPVVLERIGTNISWEGGSQ
jgi:hypothetical protein